MQYYDFMEKNTFDLEALLGFAYGTLVTDPPEHFDARLPAPPFLMLDRVTAIERDGRKGTIVGEQDIRLDAWYFQCHMPGDPVQPGCLCLDAVWQLLGFYCVWRGALGSGRALGCDRVTFNGQIRPHNRVVRYLVDVIRFSRLKESGASVVVADARMEVDGETIMTVEKARTGVFRGIAYKDYPLRSKNAIGGIMDRGNSGNVAA